MKKIFLFALLGMLFSARLMAQTATPPTAGDGTSSNPYQIGTLENLYWLSQTSSVWSSFFIQTSDIDASGTITWNGGTGFIPIGNNPTYFAGTYDGHCHTIAGLYIKRPTTGSQGLFGYIRDATIKNLGVTGVNITGNYTVGALVGHMALSSVSNCYSTGTVRAQGGNMVGGLVGSNALILSDCYSTCNVSGAGDVGGLVGRNMTFLANVNNCYSTGKVSGGDAATTGGLVGSKMTDAKVSNSFWNTQTSGQTISAGGIGLTSDQMKNLLSYTSAGWDFMGEITNGNNNYWGINSNENNGYPFLNWQGFAQPGLTSAQAVTGISSATATCSGTLYNFGKPAISQYGFCWNTSGDPTISDHKTEKGPASATANFTSEMTDLSIVTTYYVRAYATNSGGTTYSNQVSFTTKDLFMGSGTVDDPYVISVLEDLRKLSEHNEFWDKYFIQTANIDASPTSGWNYDEFEAKHLGFKPIGVSGNSFKGNYNGKGYKINNLYINKTNTHDVGFFGQTYGAVIHDLILEIVNITGLQNVGGIAGTNLSNSTIINCSSSGTVNGTSNVGGLVGFNYIGSRIERSYSSGTVNCSESQAGGITGNNNNGSSIIDCYTVCSVKGIDGAGGITGINYNNSLVSNSYSAGSVTGNTNTGGLAGWSDAAVSDNSFWNIQSTGQLTSAGGEPKTTSEMKTQNTFTDAGWDFYGESANGADNIWAMYPGVNNGYPFLSWQYKIWNGVGNWNTVANWSTGTVPSPGSNILIASGGLTVNYNINVADFTILPQATVTIRDALTVACSNLYLKSDAAGTASLINNGTLTASGTTYAESYLTGNKWHIVAPAAAGGSISTFIQDAYNAIPSKEVSGTNSYGMMDYNEASNSWNGYFTASTTGNLTPGKGYSLRRSNDGVVTCKGILSSGTKTVSLSKSGDGWNSIGNPYPSAINMNNDANAANNFLLTNSSNLDGSYACIYVWDDGAAAYKILGNSSFGSRDLGQNAFQSGQGFFVKAKDAGSSVTFTSAMQLHQPVTELKSAKTPWPGFTLIATTTQAVASTIVTFNNQMTKGLDVTYDAGLLRGKSGLSLYSRLVDDNGVDFAIQCLPDHYNSLVIPVGVDCETGGEIIFSAQTVELPATCSIILEDKLTKTFTLLGTGASCKTNMDAGNKGTGRFYIHTSSITTGATLLPHTGTFNLKAYPANGQLHITGEVSASAKAYVFDLNGRILGNFSLQEGSRNSIPVTNLAPGVYLLRVTDGNNLHTTKVVIY